MRMNFSSSRWRLSLLLLARSDNSWSNSFFNKFVNKNINIFFFRSMYFNVPKTPYVKDVAPIFRLTAFPYLFYISVNSFYLFFIFCFIPFIGFSLNGISPEEECIFQYSVYIPVFLYVHSQQEDCMYCSFGQILAPPPSLYQSSPCTFFLFSPLINILPFFFVSLFHPVSLSFFVLNFSYFFPLKHQPLPPRCGGGGISTTNIYSFP